jgi:hypothetical protein
MAALGLTTSFPAPNFFRASLAEAARIPSDDEDPPPDNAELPEVEACSGDFGLPTPVRRRLSLLFGPDGAGAPRPLWLWMVLSGSQTCPWWLIRFATGLDRVGHFLDEGRALLFWFQSQTCESLFRFFDTLAADNSFHDLGANSTAC